MPLFSSTIENHQHNDLPFWKWQGFCHKCGKGVKNLNGLFCQNFNSKRGDWPACHRVWCGRCYEDTRDVEFHISLPENDNGVVWEKKANHNQYLTGRDGVMLISPFQCDLCWFCNLKGMDPDKNKLSHENLLVYIRRPNLDMLWGSRPGTVSTTRSNICKGLKICQELGIHPTYTPMGPWPLEDNVGFTVALQLLKASTYPGKYSSHMQQFDSIRALRTAFSNEYESSAVANKSRVVLRGEKGALLHPSTCPTQSLFFLKNVQKDCSLEWERM